MDNRRVSYIGLLRIDADRMDKLAGLEISIVCRPSGGEMVSRIPRHPSSLHEDGDRGEKFSSLRNGYEGPSRPTTAAELADEYHQMGRR